VLLKNKSDIRPLHEKLIPLAAVSLLLCVFLGSIDVVQLYKDRYVNKAVAHFEQSMKIIGPYLQSPESTLLRAEFASMKKKSDFITLMEKMNAIAEKNKVSLPRFVIW